MQYADKPFGADVPIMSPENAYMSGALKTDNLDDLRRFEAVFPLQPQVVMKTALELRDFYSKRGSLPTSKEKMDVLFLNMIPKVFVASAAADWNANLQFKIEGAGDYTVTVKGGAVVPTEGLVGKPTCTVTSHFENFRKLLRFEMLEDSGGFSQQQLERWQDDESMDRELSDDMLEAVAGGKGGGGCGAEASHQTACGADACGAAAGGRTACGAAACAVAGGAYTACGADACGAAVGIGTACGAAACPAAACAGAACGADAGVGACAGAACGAAVGAGVCAGNVCGVDVLGGADVGPCAINVIPCVPGC